MSVLFSAFLLATAAPGPTPQPEAGAFPCGPARPIPAQTGEAPGARKLGELPPADLHLTVMRSIGGCALATIKTDGRTRLVPLGHSDRAVTPAGGTPRRR
jgi:hypothetical protein